MAVSELSNSAASVSEDMAQSRTKFLAEETARKLKMDAAYFLSRSNLQIQKDAAPILRAAAINHLRTSDEVVAKAFRGEYIKSGMGDYADFLAKQSKSKVWGTDLEATALGELLGVNVVVTPVQNGVQKDPIALYHTEEGITAPTVHLFNSDNTHWYAPNKSTIGDGNCLYNAFAQELDWHVRTQNPAPSNASVASSTASSGMFSLSQKQVALANYLAAEKAIIKFPKPSEVKASLEAEQKRINNLSTQEKNQIENDYKLALELAKNFGYIDNNLYAANQSAEVISQVKRL